MHHVSTSRSSPVAMIFSSWAGEPLLTTAMRQPAARTLDSASSTAVSRRNRPANTW
jgi:hypothetical protein